MKATTTAAKSEKSKAFDVLNAKTADLVSWYNEHSGKPPVKKFADRQTAEKRCLDILKSQPKPVVAWSPESPKAKYASKADVAHLFGNDAPKAKVLDRVTDEPKKGKCAVCGKSTVNSGRDATGLGLCDYCYDEAGLENALSDGQMTQDEFDAAITQLKADHKRNRNTGMTDAVRAQMSAQQRITWEDPEVRAARAERSAVAVSSVVQGKVVTQEFRSVRQAFLALNLNLVKHIPFRMRLKEEAVITAEYGYDWSIIPLNY